MPPPSLLLAKDLLSGSSDNTTEESSASPSETKEQATPQSSDPARQPTRNQLIQKQQSNKGRRLLRNLKKRLYHLGIALRIGKKVRRSQPLPVEIRTHRDVGVKVPDLEADQTPSTFLSAISDKPSERIPREAEHPRTTHCDSPAQLRQSTTGHTQAMATNNSIAAGHFGREEAANSDPLSIPVGHSRREQDPKSARDKQDTIQGLMSAQQHQPLVPTPGTNHEVTTMAGIQTPAVAHPEERLNRVASASEPSKDRKWKRWFHMVIHLANDDNAQRVTCVDTGADVDVISIHVVNSLGLDKERYQGPSLKPIGGIYVPQWQVTFDWHVAKFKRTYTSTFAVLDEAHSGDFDILLGRVSVENIGFYYMNGNVWFNSTNEEEVPPSLGVDDAKHILPSIEVDKRMGG